ncbi:response regulator transcription factor [Nonomuraea terrae]|uniref:Response regulator transcription factor n=1 Tax=Nonomuraea terrae TaxID=2530383 RepID=A0A4R4YN84_9ACTN|nr:response regulator transcription factor [Nonomuraea terrae]TDD46496.1 response regulator transcription factor [Nonomuraea terrae]
MPHYAKTEALRLLRNRRHIIFVVAFPVMLYLINANMYGRQIDPGGVTYSVVIMVSMAAYGALSAAVMSTAVPWAVRNYLSSAIQETGARNRIEAVRHARARGWL